MVSDGDAWKDYKRDSNLKCDSIGYINRHHDYFKVAKRYSYLYSQLLS